MLNALAREIREINHQNGWRIATSSDWGEGYEIPGILCLIHSEISEALEAYRMDDRENFDEELADALIRILDLAAGMGVDMDTAVGMKLARNKTRGYRHGGKKV